jgi:hypothetical protein
MIRFAVVLFCLLLLSGCGAINPVTVTDNMVDEAGNIIGVGIVKTSDVDVVRSTNFKQMRINRDNKQALAHKSSGYKIKFQTIDIGNGFKAYLPSEISMQPELRFQDPMPQQEMVNPMYATVKDITLGFFDFTLKGFIGWVLGDAHKNSVEASQPRYGGDYNYHSLNQTAEPFIVNPVVIQP